VSEAEKLRLSWIANAPAWCDAVRKGRIESRRLVTDQAIIAAVLDQSPRSVLDLGCGEGWLARVLASHGIAVTGVDASRPLIDAARETGGGRFIAVSYEEIVANPSVVESTFDVVVANFSLLDDRIDELLSALAAALSPGGTFIVQTVHPPFACGSAAYVDGWRTETFDAIPGEWREAMPWYFRTLGSWMSAFARAGYRVTQIREPMYPDRPVPASIVFLCQRATCHLSR
jgi:2-polyprenyl-3-methyl-5-hydroxy-6-metoxy-1,4-benzoquinol methylase